MARTEVNEQGNGVDYDALAADQQAAEAMGTAPGPNNPFLGFDPTYAPFQLEVPVSILRANKEGSLRSWVAKEIGAKLAGMPKDARVRIYVSRV